ncbi:Trm112 family protein [Streptomyces sp. NPDC018031]|uniref:Trm112 family protein n=1 Tax=Streptomyces sp. NPDC018031 TaxID=3365033 RepID=UPI0037B3AE2B
MKPDDPLLKILACPLDKGPLALLAPGDALYNPRLRLRYPVLDGIPQLLPSSGEKVGREEHERLLTTVSTGASGDAPVRGEHLG